MIDIKYERVSNEIVPPMKATEDSAGFDLYISEPDMVCSGCTRLLKTGLKLEIPKGYVGLIYSRSGMAKEGFVVANGVGVIDSDYRGEIGVLIHNRTAWDKVFMKGTRIAQIVFQPVPTINLVESTLSETDRGEGGFGSTGS